MSFLTQILCQTAVINNGSHKMLKKISLQNGKDHYCLIHAGRHHLAPLPLRALQRTGIEFQRSAIAPQHVIRPLMRWTWLRKRREARLNPGATWPATSWIKAWPLTLARRRWTSSRNAGFTRRPMRRTIHLQFDHFIKTGPKIKISFRLLLDGSWEL